MIHSLRTFALVLAVLAAPLASAAQGVPNLPLPAPPTGANNAAGTIFDAMLAISRAVTTNPAGAQTATFAYTAAIQQYNAGDLTRARQSALQAISQTMQAPPPPSAPPAGASIPALPSPAYAPMPRITNVAQADAEEFLALARRAVNACSAEAAPNLATTQTLYERAVKENVAHRYQDVRRDANAIINACAPAQRTLNQQPAVSP